MMDRASGTATKPTTSNVKGHALCSHPMQYNRSMPTGGSFRTDVRCCLQEVTKLVAGIQQGFVMVNAPLLQLS